MLFLSVAGLIPVAGDTPKATKAIGEFSQKNADKLDEVADLLNIVNKNMPDVAKGLGKSDEFVEAVQKLTKIDTAKLTREQAEAVREVLSEPELKKYLDEATNPWIRRAVDEGGTSTLNDWVNRIPELSKQAPIEIPSSATVKVQAKNGYDQISFKWTENGQNYEVRWHTKTPGAPEGQGNTWVVSRVTPGTPTGQVRTEHILVGDTWIPRYQWQDAINAYRNGTATQEQLQLLKDGHWQAP